MKVTSSLILEPLFPDNTGKRRRQVVIVTMKPIQMDDQDYEASVPFIDDDNATTSQQNACSQAHLDHGIWRPQQQSPHRNKGFWLFYGNITLFLVSIVILFESGQRTLCPPCSSNPPSLVESLQAVSSWSPVFDWVDLGPIATTIDGRLHAPPNASIYRDGPSPQADVAWDELAAEAYEVILVNSSTLTRAGYKPEHYFRAPDSWKTLAPTASDEDLFPVQIDVFHQIHCLNAVRKQMHYDYYFADKYGSDGPDDMHWMHMRHCLHMVLQSLTCSAAVDLVPHRWVENDDVPFAQFGISKQCRNFDKLRQWNQENAIKDVRAIWPHDKTDMPDNAFVWPAYGEP